MAQVIDIKRVEVGPKYLTARVSIDASAPLMTSEDLEGTTRVYRLLPRIIDHVCLGDHGETFKDVMGDTELAHLLEHVTVEILAQTDIAGDVTYGRTYAVEGDPRTFDVEFPCADDALVIGALSSAAWILQWAYTGGGEPEPDVAATVRGLVSLIGSLPEPPRPLPSVREYVVEGEEARAILEELGYLDEVEEPEEVVEVEETFDEEGEPFAPVPSWMAGAVQEHEEAPRDEAYDEPYDDEPYDDDTELEAFDE